MMMLFTFDGSTETSPGDKSFLSHTPRAVKSRSTFPVLHSTSSLDSTWL